MLKTIKTLLPEEFKNFIKKTLFFLKYSYWIAKSFYNRILLESLLHKYPRIHLGCGDIRFEKFINIDKRATRATDIVADCTNLEIIPSRSVSYVFSNAFLEHVYLNQRQKCVNEIYRVLKNNGKAVILSIPDFEEIARSYLSKSKITKNKPFDLHQAYRLTHGDPEQAQTWWLAQLHKTLFDSKTVRQLFQDAGFAKCLIFRASYADDLLPLSLGVIAYKSKNSRISSKKAFIAQLFEEYKLKFNPKSIEILFDNT